LHEAEGEALGAQLCIKILSLSHPPNGMVDAVGLPYPIASGPPRNAAARDQRKQMTLPEPKKEVVAFSKRHSPLGLAAIARMAFERQDLAPLKAGLVARLCNDADDAHSWYDLSIIEHMGGDRETGLALQALALRRQRCFRSPPANDARPLRLLALSAPGDFMANTPLEFLVERSGVELQTFYIMPDEDFPSEIPDHDVAFVAVAEMDANRAILQKIAWATSFWAHPLINRPHYIARLTRDGVWRLLHDVAGVVFPVNLRIKRDRLSDIACGAAPLPQMLRRGGFPIIARPAGSHAGEGLARIDDRAALANFLRGQRASDFYIAAFVDYRSEDGLFRKCRIALIDAVPYAVHMAISKNWMVHYLNADMIDNEGNRAEEARFMEEFQENFAARHAGALKEISWRSGLDYMLLDCAETRQGELLIFETGTAMIVHSLDSAGVFSYKRPHMQTIFDAFERLLQSRAQRGD
jgi:hypothetical protein